MVKDRSSLDDVFHALSDPTRRAIVGRLARGECSIGELVEPGRMSFVAVSKHVRTLERAGLIRREVQGRRHVCRLDADALGEAWRWLGVYERYWNERLDALEALIEDERASR